MNSFLFLKIVLLLFLTKSIYMQCILVLVQIIVNLKMSIINVTSDQLNGLKWYVLSLGLKCSSMWEAECIRRNNFTWNRKEQLMAWSGKLQLCKRKIIVESFVTRRKESCYNKLLCKKICSGLLCRTSCSMSWKILSSPQSLLTNALSSAYRISKQL